MNIVGAIGYGIAAAAFMLLAVLMMVSWRGRRQGVYLITASVITGIWALLLTGQAFVGQVAVLPLYVAEAVRNGAWLFALCSLAGSSAPRGLTLVARAAPLLALLALPVLSVLQSRGVHVAKPELLLSRMGLTTSLLGLILLEQIYRNSSEASRESLKYFACGVGALFAYDLFIYSQAELLQGNTADAWNSRGAIIAFAAPLIAVAVQREPRWSLDVFVSRQAVFYTTTFMGVGAYLLLMAAGGFYVREFGGKPTRPDRHLAHASQRLGTAMRTVATFSLTMPCFLTILEPLHVRGPAGRRRSFRRGQDGRKHRGRQLQRSDDGLCPLRARGEACLLQTVALRINRGDGGNSRCALCWR